MKLYCYLWWSAISVFGIAIAANFFDEARAQSIAPDGTTPTRVTSPDNLNYTIIDGSRAGNNLFHSFSGFSVTTGGSATYSNPLDIQNIFTRVTGTSTSNIDGLIKASGNANLFLINPNGIIFGPNARLNIGGSFLASTASTIKFSDGTSFGVTTPNTPPLLTVSIPVGLQYGSNAAAINVQGSTLAVRSLRTLALFGGNVTVSGAQLTAPQGRIELGGVDNGSSIDINPTATGFRSSYESATSFKDIQLLGRSSVDASGIGGGDIQVQARSLRLSEGSRLVNFTLGPLPGGNIAIDAKESVELTGSGTYTRDILWFAALAITPDNLRNGIFSLSFGAGAAGNVAISAPRFIARDGAFIATSTIGQGKGGNLTLNALDTVDITASALITGTGNAGDAGNLTINTRALTAGNLAVVATSSQGGTGRVGNLTVNATESVELIGANAIPVPSTTGLIAGLIADNRQGTAGDIQVTTRRLTVRDGAGLSSSSLTGRGGNLTVTATEAVELIGKTPNGQNVSSISAIVLSGETSQGGTLTLRTDRLLLEDGGRISVRSRGIGNAGNINIIANSIRLDRATIAATSTESGEGGNINLTTQLLQLRNNSTVFAEAGTSQGRGNGGNLTINADTIVSLGNSDISANAFQGNGGRIDISTTGIFRSLDSDITASSQLGISGEVKIDTPDIDPGAGLVVLPTNAVNVEELVATDCSSNRELSTSRFTVVGRGGLPPTPEGTLASESVLPDIRTTPISSADNSSGGTVFNLPKHRATNSLVEATGWSIDSVGRVVLIASSPIAAPFPSKGCSVPEIRAKTTRATYLENLGQLRTGTPLQHYQRPGCH